ncbi:MAG: FAD-dependent monooxygenase [Geodermatophilaceae bacterium]|nr:FAD-dependent monooxygenase [Geodermatophilaceae bacterium]
MNPLLDPRPVVVVGAGPVGQTTALLLARWGVPVTVVDPRPGRDLVGSKAICQQRDVLDVWDTVGAGRQLAEEGVTWTTARTFYRDTELFATHFRDRGSSPFPPFVNISQSRTEEVLDQRLAESSLVQVLWDHEVVALDQDDDGVVLRCRTRGGDVSLSTPYVVACPGGRGEAIRRMLGLSFAGQTFGDQFLICDIRTDLPGWQDERRFYFDPEWNPGRQVLIHPCPDSTYRIDWQVPPDFDLAAEASSGRLDGRIRQIIGDLDYEIVWKSSYRFQSRIVDRMQVGRVLVAGDAAHLVAPFGARGLNSGVLDAENAAWKLAYVLRGWAAPALLASYHAERHAAARENLEVTGATMRFLVPPDVDERRARGELLERSRNDEAARAEVDSGRLAEPFWYVDSPLTTADPTRPFRGRPVKGSVPEPGPGILVPDCPIDVAGRPEVVRLRQLLRGRVTVLLGEAVDPGSVAQAVVGVDAPVAVHRMGSLSPDVATILGAGPDEAWVVRPDAHVAAVVSEPTQIAATLRRLLAQVPDSPPAGQA